ncbi:hypothetical protein PENSPDRAFT_501383 [Peniophora sp. CONT]|nr:hypothetical protein PENSPDRAFT_501383 [Peniophora sp. CONT]
MGEACSTGRSDVICLIGILSDTRAHETSFTRYYARRSKYRSPTGASADFDLNIDEPLTRPQPGGRAGYAGDRGPPDDQHIRQCSERGHQGCALCRSKTRVTFPVVSTVRHLSLFNSVWTNHIPVV